MGEIKKSVTDWHATYTDATASKNMEFFIISGGGSAM